MVTPVERAYLKESQFEAIVREQQKIDAEIDQQVYWFSFKSTK